MPTDSRAALIEALRYDLIGPMRPDEIIDQRPTRWYLAGFLVPKGTAAFEATDAVGAGVFVRIPGA